MLDAFQDEQGGKDDWNGEQERERSGEEVRVSGNQVVSFVSIFVNLYEESDFHSE